MDEPNKDEVKPIEPPPSALDIKEGDSQTTRIQKKLLKALSWEQKISLAAFVLLLLTLPITLVAVYGPTRLFPQATPPKPTPVLTLPTPTTSPTPTITIKSKTTIVPAP